MVQDGSDGINATFPVEVFPLVAEIVGLRRRRHLSPVARERLVAMGKVNLARINNSHVDAPEKQQVLALKG